MRKKILKLMIKLFKRKLLLISKEYGMGEEYIQGQLQEANCQIDILKKKLFRSDKDEL